MHILHRNCGKTPHSYFLWLHKLGWCLYFLPHLEHIYVLEILPSSFMKKVAEINRKQNKNIKLIRNLHELKMKYYNNNVSHKTV